MSTLQFADCSPAVICQSLPGVTYSWDLKGTIHKLCDPKIIGPPLSQNKK